MKRNLAEKITTEYLNPVYGFALKRCANLQDAEDLTQEIILRVFRALLARDDLETPEKFIWTVAHNALANYYRDKTKTAIGVPIDELAELLPSNDDTAAGIIEKESIDRLHCEIAYLSKLQRRIVIAYYFENKKQEAIANELSIPIGTVKWHLFEAKKDLKRGMDTMRNLNELKFHPVEFRMCGSSGRGNSAKLYRSALSQNIIYAVRSDAKTVCEIADCLGVSPVYVESEAEYLEKYGILTENSGKYLCNIILDEDTKEIIELQDNMYDKVAELFAGELFDALTESGIICDKRIVCANPNWKGGERTDDNFILWSLIPYIAALSGESLMDKSISFDEAATIRPDGGHNICYASVPVPNAGKAKYADSMSKWFGPCWNGFSEKKVIWTVDSEWSDKRIDDDYPATVVRDLTILEHFFNDDTLTDEEYAYLAQRGYLKICKEGEKKAVLTVVWLRDSEIQNKLIAIGDRIKETHWAEMQALRAPYIKAVLDATPKHLHTMQKYGLQYIFFSDGWFILHCMKELVNNGKLKLPTEEQKKSLTTIIVPNK